MTCYICHKPAVHQVEPAYEVGDIGLCAHHLRALREDPTLLRRFRAYEAHKWAKLKAIKRWCQGSAYERDQATARRLANVV